jgi:glycosyltransferase involved in cell wall biosynthesis
VKLHTVFVTYNRLELTKRTIASYLETVTLPYTMVVVDNASTDGTQDWLMESFSEYDLLKHNRYPGFAANLGFQRAPNDATHFHRSDNDMEYLPGWCDEVQERFENQMLWQLGLRTVEEEGPHAAVGGNCVLAREAWEAGIRYSEASWHQVPFEDAHMAQKILRAARIWDRVRKPCTVHIGLASRDDPYYQETFSTRKITFEQYGL